VPSVLIPKICKEAFSLIWTMPNSATFSHDLRN
jgi:hypothetical protein